MAQALREITMDEEKRDVGVWSVAGVWVDVLATLIKGMGMVEEGSYGRKDGPTFH
jgi:hypothetical protein